MAAATKKTTPGAPIVTDPFAVIPVQPENVEQRRDSRGMIHLRLTVAPVSGWGKKLADLLHYDYTRKLELDENGTLYYSLVDGTTTLGVIVERMAAKLGISRKEAEEAVVLFTKKLMTMNMLALKVPEGAQARRPHEN